MIQKLPQIYLKNTPKILQKCSSALQVCQTVFSRVVTDRGKGTESGLPPVKCGSPPAMVGNRIGCLPPATDGNRIVVCRQA